MSSLLFLKFENALFNQAQFRSPAVFRPKWSSWTGIRSPAQISSYLTVEKHIWKNDQRIARTD